MLKLTLSVRPSSVVANPKANNVLEPADLLIIVEIGISDSKSNIAHQANVLYRRRWAVDFAEDYLRDLESKDAGWGLYTQEIVEREQTLLPAMRRKVVAAEIRLQHAESLLTQFELLHRLLSSTLARMSPDNPDEETKKMTWGLRLFDTQWKKMHDYLVVASQFVGRDDSFYVYFNFRFQIARPDGTSVNMQSNAMDGPIQLRDEDAGCEIKVLIGGGARLVKPPDTQQEQASTEGSATIEDGAQHVDTARGPAVTGKRARNKKKRQKAKAKAKAKATAKSPEPS